MIVYDKIENLTKYAKYRGAAAISEFLKNIANDIPDGKYDINENCFARVSTYKTKEDADGLFEAHKKYVDLQYVLSGEEYVEVQDIAKCKQATEFDSQKDVWFFSTEKRHNFLLGKGYFMFLEPDDAHRPGVAVDGSQTVKKIIVKIKI